LALDIKGPPLITEGAAWIAVLVGWGTFIHVADRDGMRKILADQIETGTADMRRRLDQFEAAGLLHTLGVSKEREVRLAVVHDITSTSPLKLRGRERR
jgi:hypothetical protein